MRWHVAGQQERFLVLALSLGTVFLLLSVCWLAHTTIAPQTTVTGILTNAENSQSYLAKMRQGFAGHWAETVDFAGKQAAIARFFDPETTSAWRQRVLSKYGVDYEWFGPREKALGAFEPASADYLEPVYSRDGIILFAVSLQNEETGHDRSPALEPCLCRNPGAERETLPAKIGEGGR